jgi:glycosyltransferase involved in cell wall biosynthesis
VTAPSPHSPVVSIVMATYNFERFVARAIESALAQDYPADALDIIVVDDGSTDSTPEVVKPYLDRIRYIRKPNGGLLSTMNRGIEEARGELICLFSGDDEYVPEKTRAQVDLMLARPEVGLVYTDLELVDDRGIQFNPSLWAVSQITPLRGKPFGALLARNVVSGGTIMFRASLKPHFHPIPDSAAWEDWYIALKVAAVAEIDYIPRALYRYRYHGQNMNLGAQGDKLAGLLREELKFRRSLLAGLEPGLVTIGELVVGWAAFNNNATQLSEMTSKPLEELLPVSEDQRARAVEAVAAARAGDRTRAAFLLVNALAEDPWNAEAQRDLARMLQPERAPAGVDGARSFATLAFADELVETPEMLTAYGERFTGADDATLVVLGDAHEIEALGGALEAAGLAGEDGPDMLAIDRGAAAAVATQVHAVYSRRPRTGMLSPAPLVGDAGALLQEAS